MKNSELVNKLLKRQTSVTLENILDNARADSGGRNDLNFLKYLIDNNLLIQSEYVLKRTNVDFKEEYYRDKYKKTRLESDRHYFCRVIIQSELEKMGIPTVNGINVGNMSVLRANSNYDIVTYDYSALIDIGLTPARNFFRGLTELRVKNYLLTTYFDDYMDDIIFSSYSRSNDEDYLDALRDFEEGFKNYIPNPQPEFEERKFYNSPHLNESH